MEAQLSYELSALEGILSRAGPPEGSLGAAQRFLQGMLRRLDDTEQGAEVAALQPMVQALEAPMDPVAQLRKTLEQLQICRDARQQ